MDPQVLGVIAGATAVGVAGGKLIDNIWSSLGPSKKNGNAKLEMYLAQLWEGVCPDTTGTG